MASPVETIFHWFLFASGIIIGAGSTLAFVFWRLSKVVVL